MDSYAPLLEKTRVPQPSLQKYAVISIFEKLRTAPPHLGLDSDPGRDAVNYCLRSSSAAVVEHSVVELCRLAKDSKLDISRGLLELQSALEASDSRFVNVFVKAIGFIVQLGFRNSSSPSPANHPFIKILSCRTDTQSELVQQVGVFMLKSKHLGMASVCDYLRPLLNYSIVQMPILARFRSFVRALVSLLTSLSCSFPTEAMPVVQMLMQCLHVFPCQDSEDVAVLRHCLECTVDSYVAILRQLVEMRRLLPEMQLCGVKLLEAIFSLHKELRPHPREAENIFEISRHLLGVQKEIGLHYVPGFSSVLLSLFLPLTQSKLEHEQLAILKLVLFLVEWKIENDLGQVSSELSVELLFIFPIINIASSPSKFVKQAAIALITSLEKKFLALSVSPQRGLDAQETVLSVSSYGCIIYRFLLHLWNQDPSSVSYPLYLNFTGAHRDIDAERKISSSWTSSVQDYAMLILKEKKSAQILSKSQEIFAAEISSILGAIAGVCLMHQKLGNPSVDLLAIIGNLNPELGVPLMLFTLFTSHTIVGNNKDIDFHGILLKLLGSLSSLASHPAMVPLIIQTVLPMLHKEVKPVLYSTAVRLICKTWEINDRVFGNLQGVLQPSKFVEFASERDICVSMAASVLDVCRKNPDRGVDLVLSVAACIENEDTLIQSLGLRSLAHLCESDVVDFYTAWDVIKMHVLQYKTNALVAYSLCILLRWGAMDVEAYPEAASHVLNILWEVGTSRSFGHGPSWAMPRATAFLSLSHYEVEHLLRSIPKFKEVNVEFFLSETEPEVLRALEGFESRIINHDFINRRSFGKQKRESRNKIEKLLDVFPQVIFPTGNTSKVTELPGASLLCLSFASVDLSNRGLLKELEEVNAKFENVMVEIASSLQLSRNILVAHVSLQSWKPFMQRWMKVQLKFLGGKPHSSTLDNTSKAANNILKIIRQNTDESIPRTAENLAFAIGALCSVLPQQVHAVKFSASKFLCSWCLQHEHEYRQWAAAISLGVISSCLHVTDTKQKFENINVLLKVATLSKSTLVKGACGVGLGFSCEDLLKRVDSEGTSSLGKESYKTQEVELLRNIIKVLSHNLSQFDKSSADMLQNLPLCIPLGRSDSTTSVSVQLLDEYCDDLDEDIWGIAGLILGLASSVRAIYNSGAHDAVVNIKEWIFSHVLHFNPSMLNNTSLERHQIVLSVGSCLAVPVVVAFCQQVELLDDTEVDNLATSFIELISKLASVEQSSIISQSLLMASCVGAGNLVSSILNGSVFTLKVNDVKDILSLCRKSYSSPHPHFVHLGGMLGVVSSLGANVGFPVQFASTLKADFTFNQEMESSRIMGPLISVPLMEPDLTLLVREIFLVAQSSNDHRLREFASWAISLLRHFFQFRRIESEEISSQEVAVISVSPEDSFVVKISTWLMHMDPGMAATSHLATIVIALRCLSYAPRLPMLEWGSIIRRCMRYEDQVVKLWAHDSSLKKGGLREECLSFSLRHANQVEPLLVFINELSDLPRFKTLELNLQLWLLLHLADLTKIFSVSRLQKLFEDIVNFMLWLLHSEQYSSEEKILLRTSCWNGLSLCLDRVDSFTAQEYMAQMEHCMEVLFAMLPVIDIIKSCSEISKEWSDAVHCLGKANQKWLLDFLQTSEANFMEKSSYFDEALKKVQAIARLVRIGSMTINELGKLKPYVLNSRSQVMWNVMVEVARTLQYGEEAVKMNWLLETLQIGCVTSYPSTAVRFLGLLCGNWSKYMPILVIDRNCVLSDLPVTLSSFLEDSGNVSKSVYTSLWRLTERVYKWITGIMGGDCAANNHQSSGIDESENDEAVFLLEVLHAACVLLKDHLPLDNQIALANMVLPSKQSTLLFS